MKLHLRITFLTVLFAAFFLAPDAQARFTFPMQAVDEMTSASNSDSTSDEAEEDDDFAAFEDEFGGGEDGQKNEAVYDPWEGYNRWMYDFNDGFYRYLLRPSVRGWEWLAPEGVRVALSRFFKNLLYPLRFVNNLLQAKFLGATEETGRFLVNTTVGLAGLFDPAAAWMGLEEHDEDFGQTFAVWGIPAGPPVVLPFLGQYTLRDAIGIAPTSYVNIVYHSYGYWPYLGTQAADLFNFASLHYPEYDSIMKDALDPYSYVRDFWMQNRLKKIEE